MEYDGLFVRIRTGCNGSYYEAIHKGAKTLAQYLQWGIAIMITLLEVHKRAEQLCRDDKAYIAKDRCRNVTRVLTLLLGKAPKGFDGTCFYARMLSFGYIPNQEEMDTLTKIAKSQQPNLEMPMSYQAALVGIDMLFGAHKSVNATTLLCNPVKTLNIETMSNVIVQMRKYEQVFQQMGWKS